MRQVLWMLLLGAALGACFDPATPSVGFVCGPEGACPSGYECRDTGCCHLIGSPAEECPGVVADDAAVSDAGDDAATDDAAIRDAGEADAMASDAGEADAMTDDAAPIDGGDA